MELCRSKAVEICDFHSLDPGRWAPPFTMDETELKERLDRLRSRHAAMTEAERVEPEDFVTLDSRSALPKFEKTNLNVRVGRGLFSPELEQGILGMTAGETRELELPEARARVTVRSVKRRVLPPLTDETVAAWGMDDISTVEALIASVREKARAQYVEDLAEAVAVELSGEVNANSRFALDPEEVETVCAEGRQMAEDMLRSAGLDPETADDEAVRAVSGRTKQEHYDFLRQLSIDGLKSAAIGAAHMKRDEVEPSEDQYKTALRECAEGMGLSEEAARQILTYPKFLRQTAANYLFEEIIDYVTNYMKQEEQS